MKLGRYLNIYLLLCWLILIAKLLTMQLPKGLDISLGTTFDDKIVHFALFGGLVYFLIEVIESYYLLKYVYVVFFAIILSTVYAELMEVVQSFFPGRTMSGYDTLAGSLGAIAAAIVIYWWDFRKVRKPRLLLHICCIGCGVSIIEQLSEDYEVVLFFYNPNIYPKHELKKRLEEIKRIAKLYKLKVIISTASHRTWLKKIKGHEHEPERGGRCVICYNDRLSKTAKRAKRLGFSAFTSTLSISPHKNYPVIKELGNRLSEELGIDFIDDDFKKDGGFQRSCELSKKLGLYRQNYCGCEFSIRK